VYRAEPMMIGLHAIGPGDQWPESNNENGKQYDFSP
jgi:hypothetical protein